MLLRRFLGSVVLTMCTALVFAQNPENLLSRLDGLQGSWNVMVERRLSPEAPWDTTKATSVIKRTTGGTVLEEDFAGSLHNRSLSSKTIIVFNQFTKKFQRAFIDSEHGVLVDYEGTEKPGTIWFDRTWIYPNGTKVKLRVIYTFLSGTEFAVQFMRMPEKASTWDVTDRLRYVKQKE